MNSNRGLCFLIADGEHARFVAADADNVLRTSRSFDSASAHLASHELRSDRPGRSPDRTGTRSLRPAEVQSFVFPSRACLPNGRSVGVFIFPDRVHHRQRFDSSHSSWIVVKGKYPLFPLQIFHYSSLQVVFFHLHDLYYLGSSCILVILDRSDPSI